MLADLQLRGLIPKTQKIYLREVSNYAKHFKKSPEELGEKELKEYLLYLLNDRKLSAGTYWFYYSGLKFLYRNTLKREWVVEKIKGPKRKKTLPGVLDLSEVKALLSVVENLKHRAILTITYTAGLRIAETARLKVTDIDSKRMMVWVQQGKRGKDRYTILSRTALECLRQYWRQYHPMPLGHLRAMHAVEVCRTATLGGHVDKCNSCGHLEISYNSCRNRHCPKCQTLQKERWIEARCEDLLPIQYFHVVFTIPSKLNPLVIMNQRVMYNLLFRSASETLVELSASPSSAV